MTYVDPSSSFDPSMLLKIIKENNLFSKDDSPSSNTTLPPLLQSLYIDDKKPSDDFAPCLSSLYLSVSYLNRCCVANILMSQRKFYCIDNIDKRNEFEIWNDF